MSELFTLPVSTPLDTFFEEILLAELKTIPTREGATTLAAVTHLTGSDGGDWSIWQEGGTPLITAESTEDALIQFTLSADDFREMAFGSVRDRLLEEAGGISAVDTPKHKSLLGMLMLTETEAEALLAAVQGDLQLVIDDPDEFCEYTVTITFGASTPNPDAPRAKLTVSIDDWVGMIRGKMDPQQAFMQGKIRLEGDLSLPMSLMTLATNR